MISLVVCDCRWLIEMISLWKYTYKCNLTILGNNYHEGGSRSSKGPTTRYFVPLQGLN